MSLPLTEPLLEQGTVPSPEGPKLSTRAFTTNVIMAVSYSTILGITAKMKQGGWLFTPLLITLVAVIVAEMMHLTSATIDKLQSDGSRAVVAYQDFVASAFGPWGRNLASVTCSFDQFFALCVGLQLESQNFQFLMPISSMPCFHGGEECGQKWWAVLLSFTTLVYSFIDLAPLANAAAKAGPFVCCASVILSMVATLFAIQESTEIPPSCRTAPSDPGWRIWPDASSGAYLSVAGVLSYGVYCFAVVVTAPSLRHEMAKPKELVSGTKYAFVACVFILVSIMMSGYWAFGDLGPENLIESMRTNRPAGWWATARPWETGASTILGSLFSGLTTVNMLLVDCTWVPCMVLLIEGCAPDFFRKGHRVRRTLVRLSIVICRLVVATEVSSFIALSSLSSSLFCVCNNILIPMAAFHRTKALPVSSARKAIHACIVALGCAIAVFGTYVAVQAIVTPPLQESIVPGTFPRAGISDECKAAYLDATSGPF